MTTLKSLKDFQMSFNDLIKYLILEYKNFPKNNI